MTFRKNGKKYICAAAGLFLMAALTACGEPGESTSDAMKLIQALDYQGALEELATAEESGENIRLIQRAKGIAYMGLADYESAIDCFLAALSESNGLIQDVDFDLNYYLAAAYTKSMEYTKAEEIYSEVLQLRPDEENAYFLRGNARMHLGNYDGAIGDFEKVIEMDPKNYDRLIEIYQVLDFYGFGNVGQEYLRAALASGDKQMGKYDSGRIYYYLGEYQDAYLALEEAKETGSAESCLYLGRAYEATGDYNYAANVYSSYLNKNEGTAEMYNQLGLCHIQRGDYAKALDAFQAGLALGDGSLLQTLSFNEIVAYDYLGEYEQAFAQMETYLKNYPDDQSARREYDFLSTR